MPAPVLGLQALLQALGTISVGGAVGYKAQKSLKDANIDVKDFEEPELRMLRALLMPSQAIGTQIKEDLINKKIEDKKEPEEQQSFDLVTKPMPKRPEDLISKSAPGLTGEGITLGPKAEDIEKVQEEIKQVTKPPITSTPIKPITTETFPSEPQQKPEPPVQPEIDVETKESFPDQSEKINIPIITYSKDSPENLKDLVGRSVGQEKGEKAIEKLYDDSIFEGVLDSDQLSRMRQLEDNYTGGLNDLGDAGIPVILENTMLDQHKEYMEDYKDALANAARETLGNEFKAYRLMEKDDAIRMLTEGEFPNIKRLQEDEEGNEVYKDLIIDMMGQETPLSREAFSFSLSPKEALSFRYLSAGGRRDKKDEDLVLIEMKASPTDIVMRGHESEKDLVLRVDGNVAGDKVVTPNIFNVYDIKFGEKNQVQLSENKEYKSFVDSSRAKTKKVEKEEETTEKLFNFIKNNPDGFTVGLDGETIPSSGFVVAESKLTEIAVPTKDLTREQVTQFAKNLKKLSDSTEKEIMAGGWYNDDDGKYYLDGPVVYDTLDEALYAGEAGEQIGVFDLNEGKVVDTKEGIKKLKEAGSYNSEAADVFRRNREKLDQRIREIGLQDKGQSEE
jgi:hypothetical protein